jgi:hypothetical protein
MAIDSNRKKERLDRRKEIQERHNRTTETEKSKRMTNTAVRNERRSNRQDMI